MNNDIAMISELPPELQQAMLRFRDNAIIALVKRAGGRLVIPVAEIDAASGPLTMHVEGTNFVLKMETVN